MVEQYRHKADIGRTVIHVRVTTELRRNAHNASISSGDGRMPLRSREMMVARSLTARAPLFHVEHSHFVPVCAPIHFPP